MERATEHTVFLDSPSAVHAEVLRHIILQDAVLSDCDGAVVQLQHGDSGSCGLDLEHLIPHCRYVHRHHCVVTMEALSNGALKLGRPAIFPWVS